MVGELSKLTASICLELAELVTKCVLAYNIVFSDHIVTLTKFRVGYAIVTSFAIIFLGISFIFRFRHARWVHVKLVRVTSMNMRAARHCSVAGLPILPEVAPTECGGKQAEGSFSDPMNAADDDDALESDLVRNLRWEIEKTSRDMISLSLSIGMIFFKDIPAVRPFIWWLLLVSSHDVLTRASFQVILGCFLVFDEAVKDPLVCTLHPNAGRCAA